MRGHRRPIKGVAEKTFHILWGLLLLFSLIFLRMTALALFLHDKKVMEARRPQKRKVVEKATRAAIYDRFGVVLATNRVQYNAGICYGQMRYIPRQKTGKDSMGKKIRIQPRKEYISQLARLLAKELGLEAERLEDLIYAKASLLGNVPYILKEDVSEATYFRLKMLEQQWPGLFAEVATKREYPQGAVGGEIVGYIGPMSRTHYEAILTELRILKETLAEDPTQEEVHKRIQALEKKSEALHELTGKVGIEAICDERLRGKQGKRVYLTDIKGNILHELEESFPPEAGKAVHMTLSVELQAYAEQLLAEYNQAPLSQHPNAVALRNTLPQQRPWLKEGAIVVMDPHSGDVLALASYPRFNPADFIGSKHHVGQWLESESYLGAVWDGKEAMHREKFDVKKGEFYAEEKKLDWPLYLNMVISQRSPLLPLLEVHNKVRDAVIVQKAIEELRCLLAPLSVAKIIDLLYRGPKDVPTGVLITLQEQDHYRASPYVTQVAHLVQVLAPYFSSLSCNEDKLLLLDLYRLAVLPTGFTQEFLQVYGGYTLAQYRYLATEYVAVYEGLKERMRTQFHAIGFERWREKEFTQFLARKRREERLAQRKYGKPYLDYLDEEEQRQFQEFWQKHHLEFMTLLLQGGNISQEVLPYIDSLKGWQHALMEGKREEVPWRDAYLALYKECVSLNPSLVCMLLGSLRRFDQLDRPLYGLYSHLRCDAATGERREQHLAEGFYPRYGYGYLRSHAFRQACVMGSLFKVIPAYAALSQQHDLSERGPLNPLTIVDDKHPGGGRVGFFIDGRPIPLHYHGGRLPRSDHAGIGKIDVSQALEASSNPYFALLAGEKLEDPEDLCDAARLFGLGAATGIDLVGEYKGHIPNDISYNKTGLYSMAIGQHTLLTTPLQAAVMLSALVNGGKILKPRLLLDEEVQCRWQLSLPEAVRRPILAGMRGVMTGERGTARFTRARFPPELIAQTIGKTSTAEIIENYGCDSLSRQVKNKDVWFGAVIFDPRDAQRWENPELVVIVYLRHGEFGWCATPYALKMAQRWRQLKAMALILQEGGKQP